jgi:hypothetical protein
MLLNELRARTVQVVAFTFARRTDVDARTEIGRGLHTAKIFPTLSEWPIIGGRLIWALASADHLARHRRWSMLRQHTWLRALLVTIAVGTLTVFASGQSAPPASAPPQFLTPPLHAPEQVAGTIGGHLIYTPVSGLTAPSGSTSTLAAALSLVTQIAGINVDVTKAFDSYQGEPMLNAVGSLLVGGYNSIFPGNCSAALGNCAPGSAASSDGVNWTNARLPITVNGHAFLIGFDPSVAVDASDVFYYAYGVSGGSVSGANAIAVARSVDAGAHWALTNNPVTYNNGGQFDDKYWIAADPSKAGTLYVGWDRNKGNNQTLFVAVSTDGGDTWTAPIKVNDGTSRFERVIYAFPAVDTTGTVYMAWLDYAKNTVFVDKSTNGGLTWGKDVAAAPTHIGFGIDIGCNGGRSMTPAPQLGIDGSGALYLTYADNVGTGRTSSGMDVYLVKSVNGAATWSTPTKLNDDTGAAHQYNPALAVRLDGTVSVSWYDRRNDPNNCTTDIYSTVSTDGAATFSANVRVTPVASNYDGNPNGPGDYSGIAQAGLNTSYPFWASHLATDIKKETGTAGAFEIYTAPVIH